MLLIVGCDHTQPSTPRHQAPIKSLNYQSPYRAHRAPLSPRFGQNNQTDNFPLDMDRWWKKPSPVRGCCLSSHTRKQSRGRHSHLLLQVLTSRALISPVTGSCHSGYFAPNLPVRETDVSLLTCNTQERQSGNWCNENMIYEYFMNTGVILILNIHRFCIILILLPLWTAILCAPRRMENGIINYIHI